MICSSSQQPSRSASSSSSSIKVTSVPSSTPIVPTQPPLSKRQQKAKLKLEQQQKQAVDNVDQSSMISNTIPPTTSTAPVSVPLHSASSSSQGTNTTRTNIDLRSENFDTPEEEVNWITISRKQSKHKPTPPSVPSLLAAPVLPVVPPTNTKQHRQQMITNTKKASTTANVTSVTQQKVISPTVGLETVPTTNKQQQQQHTNVAPPRLQNLLKNHASQQSQKGEPSVPSQSALQASSNLWTNSNIHEYTAGIIHLK